MPTEIEDTIAEALRELAPDISDKPCLTSQDTYICDLMYHALHCFSCGWTGAIFEPADMTDPDQVVTGLLFVPRTEALCPQCGRDVKRALRRDTESPKRPNDRRGLKLA